MSVFNPSPGQTNDPNYLNYPRVLEGPKLEGNTSGAQITKAIGDGIVDASGLIDQGIKKTIQQTAYDKVDKERDAFTQGLQGVKSQLDNGMIAPAVRSGVGSPAATGKLIMDASEDTPEVPDGLASGLDRIQQLAQAKAAGSVKLNDTQYAAQTLSIAKQLRSQYGQGYREFIDDTVSKASGLPVANSYYQNLMLDINRQLNQIGKGKDDVGNILKQNLDVPNMGTYITQRATNDPKYPGDAFMLNKVSDWQNLQSQIKIDAAKRAEKKDLGEDTKEASEKALTKNLNNLVYHHIEDNLQLSGMPDFRSLMDYFSKAQAGNIQTTDAEVQARLPQLTAYYNHIYQEAHKTALDASADIGGKKTEEVINNALMPIKTYIDMANNKDTGAAFFHLHQNQAIKEDDTNNWLINKDRGVQSRQLMTARGILGEQYFPEYLKSLIAQGQDKPFSDLFSQEALAAVAPASDARGQPLPQRTMVDAVQHAKTLKDFPKEEYVGKVTGWLEQIADPNLPLKAKDNLVKWGFGKAGLTDELRMEYRDPNTHQVVDGKYRAINLMTSDKIVNAVAETAKAHPENYTMLRNWTETEFGKVYRSDLQNLNKITSNPELKFHFSYDDTTKSYGLVDSKNMPVTRDRNFNVINPNPAFHTPEYKTYVNDTLDILDRINSGTQRLRSVYLHDPKGDTTGSVDRYILQTLQGAGLRPGEAISGAPAEMAKALMKTLKPEATPEQINKMLLGK
jgi:hypothetical protein